MNIKALFSDPCAARLNSGLVFQSTYNQSGDPKLT